MLNSISRKSKINVHMQYLHIVFVTWKIKDTRKVCESVVLLKANFIFNILIHLILCNFDKETI